MPDPLILRTPDGNACSFWWDTAENTFASQSAGHPVFDKVLKMKVFKPGDRDSQPHFEIERHMANGSIKYNNGETKGADGQLKRGPWRQILKDQIAAFESVEGGGGNLNGMPISEWARVDIAQAATLKAVGIHTVEALAETPDSQLPNIGHNARVLRDQAKAFLAAAAGQAPIDELIAKNEDQKTQIADLQRQITELAAMLKPGQAAPAEAPQADPVAEPAKRGPGRPPKQAAAA